MFDSLLSALTRHSWNEAQTYLASLIHEALPEYERSLVLLFAGYLAYHRGEYGACIEHTNSSADYLFSMDLNVSDLLYAPYPEIRGGEAMLAYVNWSSALFAQGRHGDAATYAKQGLERWREYDSFVQTYMREGTSPFLLTLPLMLAFHRLAATMKLDDVAEAEAALADYQTMLEQLIERTRDEGETHLAALTHAAVELSPMTEGMARSLRARTRIEYHPFLDILMPEGFTPLPPRTRDNGIASPYPLISVCIGTYRDGDWLKTTIDSVIRNAGYDHFEIIVVLQKLAPEDQTGQFLWEAPYRDDPRLIVVEFDSLLGCEAAKRVAIERARGEIICALDAHVVPCRNFMKIIVETYVRNPEVNVMTFGLTYTDESGVIGPTYFDEVPYHLNAVVGHKVVSDYSRHQRYRDGLHIRHSLMGAAYVITRSCYFEVHGSDLLPRHGWGDKLLGMNCYLYGYPVYFHERLLAVHKWHSEKSDFWRDTVRRTSRFEYTVEAVANALRFGYCYFSAEYFETQFCPWIKGLAGDNYDNQLELFARDRARLDEYKARFWRGARRTIREYWREYWPHIVCHLSEEERRALIDQIARR
jgi:glycosyltransferase involved in cell wall biosynthesis